ncbi:hypothetical protein [Novipirellula artificiosorum]|uniref:Uncharacterized protein n=1 Tax=Novipirellula artificiosorum TaxID=2528016 RepID=A0A5C6DKN7_9BACT|nr:hypothetical protein [Novipirellula artificiosorum]TWU37152.1 hypothetical protein Poly41_32790 [Novipirellula artificiosorum]
MTSASIFQALDRHRGHGPAMVDAMANHFRQTRQPMELFEALKMQIRSRLGLPLLASEDDKPKPEDVERQLEMGLLDACSEVGTMLIQDGKVAEGWMYLRPTGDLEKAKQLTAEIPITDDNYDAMIQVLLHEGIDVGRGFQAVLDHQGTCNSITLYEQAIAGRSQSDRQAAASRLLDHLYNELVVLVRGDIARREAPAADSETLSEMLEKRPWIMDEGAYHLDTTHLASTVRIASILDDRVYHDKAMQLCRYGQRLAAQFQYPGDEPFVDFYPAYIAFYNILLGENLDANLKQFERKARSVDSKKHGTAAMETYVDLLFRSGRYADAARAAVDLVPEDVPPQRIVPMLLKIADRAKSTGDAQVYAIVLDYCRDQNDILGYAVTLEKISN